ncbi:MULTISPECIES: helix-turn-helix domain-containing protein [Xanthomonas]|uniref:helix-turn-helix domain-containing protein n=1 Tax=Xanthomonas TaxID=338 RepID=UPI00161718C4|nr:MULTISPECIES: helix-turn-helix transcriptional regulator [Xanthomonas]MBB6259343.1 transcriptional regulator with XRE-family HTH domain [Xanthomonas arboricola]
MSVGLRLKEERKRIGLTQTELAERCGLSKRAQLNFEKDEQLPGGAYLLAATVLGVDVLYVLTGERHGISTEEAQVLAAYRVSSPEIKLAVSAALGATVKAAGRHKFVMHENEIGQALSGDINQDNVTINMGGKKAKKKSG